LVFLLVFIVSVIRGVLCFLYYYFDMLVSNYLLTCIFIDKTALLSLNDDVFIPELEL